MPFYPSAANTTTAKDLSEITITVSSTDEKLGLDTDESCKLLLRLAGFNHPPLVILTDSLTTSSGQLSANSVFGALKGEFMNWIISLSLVL